MTMHGVDLQLSKLKLRFLFVQWTKLRKIIQNLPPSCYWDLLSRGHILLRHLEPQKKFLDRYKLAGGACESLDSLWDVTQLEQVQ